MLDVSICTRLIRKNLTADTSPARRYTSEVTRYHKNNELLVSDVQENSLFKEQSGNETRAVGAFRNKFFPISLRVLTTNI